MSTAEPDQRADLRQRDAWRLIDLSLGDGPWNMAADEAVLEAVAAGRAPVTLRFYGWSEPAVSLGVTQPAADLDLAACARAGLTVVRRASGGTAVGHDASLGYSLCLPAGHSLAPLDVVQSYRELGPPVLAALCRLGLGESSGVRLARPTEAHPGGPRLTQPTEAHRGGRPTGLGASACFATLAPYEAIVDSPPPLDGPPRKIVGNAQLRRRGAVLHHGMVHLRFDAAGFAALLTEARPPVAEPVAGRPDPLATHLAARIIGLDEILGRSADLEEVTAALVAGFGELARGSGVSGLAAGELTPAERADARRLVESKYGSPAWTFRR